MINRQQTGKIDAYALKNAFKDIPIRMQMFK